MQVRGEEKKGEGEGGEGKGKENGKEGKKEEWSAWFNKVLMWS